MIRVGQRLLGGGLHERDQIEAVRAGAEVEGDQTGQGDQGAKAEIEGDLEGGKVLVRSAAPHADHDERGHQGQFMGEVEQEQIQRAKRGENATRHQQEENVELLFAGTDFPSAAGGGKSDDGAHEDEADVHAIHTDVVADAQGGNPRDLLFELEGVAGAQRGAVKLEEQGDGEEHGHPGGGEGREAHEEAVVARHQAQQQAGEQGQENEVGKHGVSARAGSK